MMKVRGFILLVTVVCLYSCNPVPNKSVFITLTSDELAPVIKRDTHFIRFYEAVKKAVDGFSEIEKAKLTILHIRASIEYRSSHMIRPRLILYNVNGNRNGMSSMVGMLKRLTLFWTIGPTIRLLSPSTGLLKWSLRLLTRTTTPIAMK